MIVILIMEHRDPIYKLGIGPIILQGDKGSYRATTVLLSEGRLEK
jgi:hypothetical protein